MNNLHPIFQDIVNTIAPKPRYRVELDDCTLSVFNDKGEVIKSQTFADDQLGIILGREFRENIEFITLTDLDLYHFFD